jgi:glycosyltransferase involved in cell wall biosynthesis
MEFSVVINCKNEEAIIGKTLAALQGFAPDIVVYDNGSTDATIDIVKTFPVKLIQGPWEGFGKTKNKANANARYNWILSLDADEMPDDELKTAIKKLVPENDKAVYDIWFKNFFGSKWLRHGEWGNDKHIRLFNKNKVSWDEAPVHESLQFPEGVKVLPLKGAILHYTAQNLEKYEAKLMKYAELNGIKYFQQGKKAGLLKGYFSSFFNFIQNYIFRLGFLDGKEGYQCAVLMARYTFAKYKKLEELSRTK